MDSPPQCLTIFNANVRSFNCNGDLLVSMFCSLTKTPDVIIITESWLTDDNSSMAVIDGYVGYHTVRQTRGGGVSI